MVPVVFAVYWSAVLAWSLMAARLCEGLSVRHPLLYEALGRPAPLAVTDIKGDLALLRFLLGGRYRFLDDRRLVRLCGAMRWLLGLYVVFFVTVPYLLR
jgi:hypothetical protein